MTNSCLNTSYDLNNSGIDFADCQMTACDEIGTQNYQRNNSQNLSGKSWKTEDLV
jgi:hypothetical protein